MRWLNCIFFWSYCWVSAYYSHLIVLDISVFSSPRIASSLLIALDSALLNCSWPSFTDCSLTVHCCMSLPFLCLFLYLLFNLRDVLRHGELHLNLSSFKYWRFCLRGLRSMSTSSPSSSIPYSVSLEYFFPSCCNRKHGLLLFLSFSIEIYRDAWFKWRETKGLKGQ